MYVCMRLLSETEMESKSCFPLSGVALLVPLVHKLNAGFGCPPQSTTLTLENTKTFLAAGDMSF